MNLRGLTSEITQAVHQETYKLLGAWKCLKVPDRLAAFDSQMFSDIFQATKISNHVEKSNHEISRSQFKPRCQKRQRHDQFQHWPNIAQQLFLPN